MKGIKMSETKIQLSRQFIRYGILLFLLGLLTGLIIPFMSNARMGLSSHLEGVMNGMFLMLIGLILHKVNLSDKLLKLVFILSLYGTFVNWSTTLFAGLIGGGAEMMPLAGNGLRGSELQEIIIKFGLATLSLCIIAVCSILFWGFRKDNSVNSNN
jgi:hydroxylaminobenzene mutase